ncbi:hypothetical protein DXG01_003893 [Tephrocybe rancida]|nr:hypothetical protein DXG01_003893 [Tephrocybe rancida]
MADQSWNSSTSSTIPPPLSFNDVKFSTIGQGPPLLKRISAPRPDYNYSDRSSSSPSRPAEQDYPEAGDSPRPFSRPTLLQALTHSQHTDDPNAMSIDTRPADAQKMDAHEQVSGEHTEATPIQSSLPPASTFSDTLGIQGFSFPRPVSLPRGQTTMLHSDNPRALAVTTESSTTVPASFPTPLSPVRSLAPQQSPGYASLRALQTRLTDSLSNLHPPDPTDPILLAQAANSHATNALTAAHRSHILAQQSLATAKEAVAAAQECLTASEQAKAHAGGALAAVNQLKSDHTNSDAVGKNVQWETKLLGLQDDLRLLGRWIGEKENEEASTRQSTSQLEARIKDKELVDAAMGASGSGLAPHVVQAMSLEVAKRVAAKQPSAGRSRPFDRSSSRDIDLQRSAELEAHAAMRAWSLEQVPAPKLQAVDQSVVPMEVEVDIMNHIPPEDCEDDPTLNSSFQEAFQQIHHNETLPSRAHQERSPPRIRQEDDARIHQETRIHEMHEKKLEVARLQMMQKERTTFEEPPKCAPPIPQFKSQKDENKPPPRSKGSAIVEDAKRALQAHKEKEVALAEQVELKKAETRRLLEERKERELAELKRKEEEKAAEAEAERLAAAKEQELIAEQGRRRQEVMAQKQRASAETAARIIAERARERERGSAASSHSPTSSISRLLDNTDSEAPTVKKTAAGIAQKSRSLSGDVKLGPTTNGQPEAVLTPDSLPPPPSVARTSPLGLRSSQAQTQHSSKASTVSKPLRPKLEPDDSGIATPIERTSSRKPMKAYRTPTPSNTDGSHSDDLQVYRRGEDPGNMCVVPRSQVPPASPEAQAANLRFVRDGNGARWEPLLAPDLNQSLVNGNPPLKRESPALPSLVMVGSQKGATPVDNTDAEPRPPVISLPKPGISLPRKPYPLPPVSPVKKLTTRENGQDHTSIDWSGGVRRTNDTSIASSTAAPLASTNDSPSTTETTKKSVSLKHPSSTVTPSNPHRDNSTLPSRLEINTNPTLEPASSSLATPIPTPRVSTNGSHSFDDASQIAPMIHANGGWDQPADEDRYNHQIEEPTPPRRPRLRRGADRYSPPPRSSFVPDPYSSRSYVPRSISPSGRIPLSPAPRPPVLGKRRDREEFREDEPPTRRQRPMDRMRGLRSPPLSPRETSQWSHVSPKWPASTSMNPEARSGRHYDIPRTRSPPSRELSWQSPPPEAPILQARIGTWDPAVHANNGDQSYRPQYPSRDTYARPPSWNLGPYNQGQSDYSASYSQTMDDRYSSGHQQTTDPEIRAAFHNRGRGSSNNRGAPRGRGARGGNRSLNLEQRISTSSRPALIDRLGSSSK